MGTQHAHRVVVKKNTSIDGGDVQQEYRGKTQRVQKTW